MAHLITVAKVFPPPPPPDKHDRVRKNVVFNKKGEKNMKKYALAIMILSLMGGMASAKSLKHGRKIAMAEQDIQEIKKHYIGIWKGSFKHLYIQSEPVLVTVNIRDFSFSGTDHIEINVNGTATITVGSVIKKFYIQRGQIFSVYANENPDQYFKGVTFSLNGTNSDDEQFFISFNKGLQQTKKSYIQYNMYGTITKEN